MPQRCTGQLSPGTSADGADAAPGEGTDPDGAQGEPTQDLVYGGERGLVRVVDRRDASIGVNNVRATAQAPRPNGAYFPCAKITPYLSEWPGGGAAEPTPGGGVGSSAPPPEFRPVLGESLELNLAGG